MSIFVIGDRDTVLGLELAGIEGEVVESADQARDVLNKVLDRSEYQILLITRPWAVLLQAELNQLKKTSLKPVVVEVPGDESEPDAPSLRELIEETVGMGLGT